MERLENKINSDTINFPILKQMKFALEQLNSERNKNAHTFITPVTTSKIAPSQALGYLRDVRNGLKMFKRKLKKIKFK